MPAGPRDSLFGVRNKKTIGQVAVNKINIMMDDPVPAGLVAEPEPGPGARASVSYAERIIDTRLRHEDACNSGVANRNPGSIRLVALIAEDCRTHGGDFFSQGFWALFWHRFGNWRMSVKPKALRAPLSLLYRIGAKLTQWFAGIDLPYTVIVGRRVRLEHFGGMILIARAIGDDVVIRQNTTFGVARADRLRDWPVIGDGVDIGAGAAILGRVDVGRGAKIGANAVVLKDIPEGAVAVGVPARIVKRG
jgi:serine O-acetyltransferase